MLTFAGNKYLAVHYKNFTSRVSVCEHNLMILCMQWCYTSANFVKGKDLMKSYSWYQNHKIFIDYIYVSTACLETTSWLWSIFEYVQICTFKKRVMNDRCSSRFVLHLETTASQIKLLGMLIWLLNVPVLLISKTSFSTGFVNATCQCSSKKIHWNKIVKVTTFPCQCMHRQNSILTHTAWVIAFIKLLHMPVAIISE